MWKQLKKENAVFVLIDFQEKFFPLLKKSHVKLVKKNIMLLINMFKRLEIPMIGTEHYQKGLGPTETDVLEAWAGPDFTGKMTFSCCGDDDFLKNLAQYDKRLVVVAGLETQICVLQTVLDLIEKKYTVVVLKDAVLSSTTLKWENGLELMKEAGAHILNTETLLFYLLKKAGTPEFKTMVNLLKEMKD